MRGVAGCLAAVMIVACGLNLAGAAGIKKPSAGSPFATSFILVTTCSTCDHLALKEVEIKQLGTEKFLVGKSVDGGRAGFKGSIVWIPLSDAGQIVEFASEQQLIKAMPERIGMPSPAGK